MARQVDSQLTNMPQKLNLSDLLRKHLNESPRGEQSALVRHFGINKSTMTRWLDGTLHPNGPHTLTIVEFLKQRKQKENSL